MQYGFVHYQEHRIWLGTDGKGGWWCKVSKSDSEEPHEQEARGPFPSSREAVQAAEGMIEADGAPGPPGST